MTQQFVLNHPPFYILPTMHYTMECALLARQAFLEIKPDCVAVELPETLQEPILRAVSRLPDVSVVIATGEQETLHFPIEPCDASLETIRSAQDAKIPAFCIDLDVENYPLMHDGLPDPHAISVIGLKQYYEAFVHHAIPQPTALDLQRELHMAKRLKALSFTYDKILVVTGFCHAERLIAHLNDPQFPEYQHAKRSDIRLVSYPEEKVRELLSEYGWISTCFEASRQSPELAHDREKLIVGLIQEAKDEYEKKTTTSISPAALSLLLNFMRKWAAISNRLLPDLYQLISSSKGCIDTNFAYEVWKKASDFPFYKNVDNLPEEPLTIDLLWGGSKKLHFHLKKPSEKSSFERRVKKEKSPRLFYPPNLFSICSYPPEDSVIEAFGNYMKKKAQSVQIETECKSRPFSTSLEEGVDVRETIRHWAERKLYIKVLSRPPGQAGSCVVIFNEEARSSDKQFPCTMTWIGEHDQESDMAFYATSMTQDIVGPGISRCQYGGLLLSYPNCRLMDVWHDPDYDEFEMKHDVLLAAAIDYSVRPVVVLLGPQPPSASMKKRASERGKKIIFLPISSLAARERKKLQTFHILDSHDKRGIADEYIL